jgi:hypothetical protein
MDICAFSIYAWYICAWTFAHLKFSQRHLTYTLAQRHLHTDIWACTFAHDKFARDTFACGHFARTFAQRHYFFNHQINPQKSFGKMYQHKCPLVNVSCANVTYANVHAQMSVRKCRCAGVYVQMTQRKWRQPHFLLYTEHTGRLEKFENCFIITSLTNSNSVDVISNNAPA